MQRPNEDLSEYTNMCASYCLKFGTSYFLYSDIYTLVDLRYRQIIVLYGLLLINLFYSFIGNIKRLDLVG